MSVISEQSLSQSTQKMSSTLKVLHDLHARIESGVALIFLQTWEEQRWEKACAKLARAMARNVTVWTATDGANPPITPKIESKDEQSSNLRSSHQADPLQFLNAVEASSPDQIFIVKDFPLGEPTSLVVRKLRDLALTIAEQRKTILFITPIVEIPLELQKESSILSLPLPGYAELSLELDQVLLALASERTIAKPQSNDEPTNELEEEFLLSIGEREKLIKAVSGLTLREAHRAYRKAIAGKTVFDDEMITVLVAEKKQMLQGSDLLEFHELQEGVGDVGGLEALKEWTEQRSRGYSEEARMKGISQPKGVLLLGVQGCGKSLSARVIARQLSFPLIRMDFAGLLATGRGSSEQNLMNALETLETIAPAVLWLEEIEKGFAGIQKDADQDSAMIRMLGRFLTWMQEHTAPIFVVATANSVESLPPELLRRGRFDELFFVDLPNNHERQHIFKIHLKKRNLSVRSFNVEELADKSDGYSGAEIEQIVNSSVIECFTKNQPVTMKALLETQDDMVPLSKTLEDQIFALREWARPRCRPATPDSRVIEMLESEQKQGDFFSQNDSDSLRKWEQLAVAERLGDALIEFVRQKNGALLSEIQDAFGQYIETTGNWHLALESDNNVQPWTGMSSALAELIAKYIQGRRLFLHPVDVSEYQGFGKVLKIPVLQKLRKKPLPRAVWFPSKLKLIPIEEGSGALGKVVAVNSNEFKIDDDSVAE